MDTQSDPRSRGFNYAGWGADPKPPVYLVAQKVAQELGKRSTAMSAEWWDMEMAIRNVRLATTAVEKVQAVQRLEAKLAPYLPDTNVDQRVLELA